MKSRKVFVIYSSHLVDDFENIVFMAKKEGYEFLSLDINSALNLKKLGIKTLFLEDFLTTDDRLDIFTKARFAVKNFHKIYSASNLKNISKVAEKDAMVFNCYWNEFYLQKALLSKFKSLKLSKLKFLSFNNFGAAVHESPSDTFGNYWKYQTDIPFFSHEIYKKNPSYMKITYFFKTLILSLFEQINYLGSPKIIQPIVFSCTYEEFYYYQGLVENLNNKTNKVILLINNINQIEARKLSKKINIEVIGLAKTFLYFNTSTSIKSGLKFSNKDIQAAYKIDNHSFKFFEESRWPKMLFYKSWLTKKISRLKPLIIVMTSIEDYRNQVLGEISEKLSIHSISLPHGILASTRLGISMNRTYGVGNMLAKRIASLSGIEDRKIKILKGLDPEHEYQMDYKQPMKAGFNILVLTNPIKSSSDTRVYSTPPVGIKDQIKGLQDISFLKDNINYINLTIKTHPGWPEIEMIEYADENLLKITAPSNTSLKDMISKVDLVIGLNYYGAALVTVLKNNKPIILHNTGPIGEFSNLIPSYSIFFNSGIVTCSSKELLATCKRFESDNTFRELLHEKARNFNCDLIAPKDSMNVDQFILDQYNSEKLFQSK